MNQSLNSPIVKEKEEVSPIVEEKVCKLEFSSLFITTSSNNNILTYSSSIHCLQSDEVEVENKPAVEMTEAETEQLMDAIRRQVEYYFSKENLQTDPYLTSHMDANMTVSIAIVMKVLIPVHSTALSVLF